MMQEIWKILKTIVLLADDMQKYNAEIKEIREELRNLTIIVHTLAQDNKHTKETSDLKHQNLMLEVEKRIQALERNLPPAKSDKKAKRNKKTEN